MRTITNNTRNLFICTVGTVLEWYDFALYAAFAPILAHLFFPTKSHFLSLLATFMGFALGYFIRPIGAIYFGSHGDRLGRKSTLIKSLIYMTLPTVLIGCLPAYKDIGIYAPLLLVMLRLLQGFSVSGEYPGAMTYLSEIGQQKEGFIASFSILGVAAGMTLGSSMGVLFSLFFSHIELVEWGWRLPFLFSIILGILGYYMRYKIEESPKYLQLLKSNNLEMAPIRQVIKLHLGKIILILGLFWINIVSFYSIFVFTPTYLSLINKNHISSILGINTFGLFLVMFFTPAFGWISDRVGKKYVLNISILVMLLCCYPLFILSERGIFYFFLSQILFAILISSYVGPLPSLAAGLFPAAVRFSGLSLSLNIGACVLGSTAPIIDTVLVHLGHSFGLVSLYIILSGLISIVAVNLIPYDKLLRLEPTLTPYTCDK